MVNETLVSNSIVDSKVNYGKLLLKDTITAISQIEKFQVSTLNAIFEVAKSWNIVSQKTIENCFWLVFNITTYRTMWLKYSSICTCTKA